MATSTVSFTNTPQAKDDVFLASLTGLTEDSLNVVYLDVMKNDSGGSAKTLWSLDDGSGFGCYAPTDLLKQDTVRTEAQTKDTSLHGAKIWITADGKVGYDLSTADECFKAQLQTLNNGQFLTDSFVYAIRLANGTLSWAEVTIQIAGRNDVAILSTDVKNLTEANTAAAISSSGRLTVNDVDNLDLFVAQNNTAGKYGTFTVTSAGKWCYTASSAHNEFAAGVTYTEIFSVKSLDGTTTTVTINILGTNDAALLSGSIKNLTETNSAADISSSGTLTISDVDNPGLFVAQTGTAGIYGVFKIDAAGKWIYTANSANNEFALGVTYTDTFLVSSIDGTTTTVVIKISGTNDAPVVSSAVTASSTEDNAPFAVNLLQNANDAEGDTLHVSNLALMSGNASGVTVSGDQLNIDPNIYNYLAIGESAVIKYSYLVTDTHGSFVSQTATITIVGQNDTPSVNSAINISAIEDNGSFFVNLLAFASDPDLNDVLSVASLILLSGDASGVTVLNGKQLVIDPRAYNFLSAGENNLINYSYNVVDGHGGSVSTSATINILGRNDAPVVANPIDITITENSLPFSVNLLNFSVDPDIHDVLTVTDLVIFSGDAHGITLSANGNELLVDPSAYHYLNRFEQELIQYTYKVSDGRSAYPQIASITINGTNDSPTGEALIFGFLKEGFSISVDTSTIQDTDGLGAFSYQWYRMKDESGATLELIPNATSQKYVIADPGYFYQVEVSYTDGSGSIEHVRSTLTTAESLNENDLPTGKLTFNGTLVEGQTLTADISQVHDDDGITGPTHFSWLRSADNGQTWHGIEGAHSASYTLGNGDVNQLIKVAFGYTNQYGENIHETGPLEWVVSDSSNLKVISVNDAPVAHGDTLNLDNHRLIKYNLFDNNGQGADSDPDAQDQLSIATVNGVALNGSTTFTLSTGVQVTVKSDGQVLLLNSNFASSGDATFSYSVKDQAGALSNSVFVTVHSEPLAPNAPGVIHPVNLTLVDDPNSLIQTVSGNVLDGFAADVFHGYQPQLRIYSVTTNSGTQLVGPNGASINFQDGNVKISQSGDVTYEMREINGATVQDVLPGSLMSNQMTYAVSFVNAADLPQLVAYNDLANDVALDDRLAESLIMSGNLNAWINGVLPEEYYPSAGSPLVPTSVANFSVNVSMVGADDYALEGRDIFRSISEDNVFFLNNSDLIPAFQKNGESVGNIIFPSINLSSNPNVQVFSADSITVFVPNANFSGVVVFNYTADQRFISQGNNNLYLEEGHGKFYLTVNSVDDLIQASDDIFLYKPGVNSSTTLNVLANDMDIDTSIDKKLWHIDIVQQPTYGVASIDANNHVVYKVTSNSYEDSFSYRAADTYDANNQPIYGNTVTVNLKIDHAPVASNDTATTEVNNGNATIFYGANDTDVDMAQFSTEHFSIHSIKYGNAPVSLVHTLNNTEMSFTKYGIMDNNSISYGTSFFILGNAQGPNANGDILSFISNGEFDYLAAGESATAAILTYTLEDSLGLVSNEATVTVTVRGKDDLPTSMNFNYVSGLMQDPVVSGYTAINLAIPESMAVNTVIGRVKANDPDLSDQYTYQIIGSASNFSVAADGTLRTTGAFNFDVQNQYVFTVRGTKVGTSNFIEKQVVVQIKDELQNAAPVAHNDAVNMLERAPLVIGTVLDNDTDADHPGTDSFNYLKVVSYDTSSLQYGHIVTGATNPNSSTNNPATFVSLFGLPGFAHNDVFVYYYDKPLSFLSPTQSVTDVLRYTVQDEYGATSQGIVNITINGQPDPNTAPSFVPSTDMVLTNGLLNGTVMNWATNLQKGSGEFNENGQTLTFHIDSVFMPNFPQFNPLTWFKDTDHDGKADISIDASGNLSYRLVDDIYSNYLAKVYADAKLGGYAVPDSAKTVYITTHLTDNGGTAFNGVDSSQSYTFGLKLDFQPSSPDQFGFIPDTQGKYIHILPSNTVDDIFFSLNVNPGPGNGLEHYFVEFTADPNLLIQNNTLAAGINITYFDEATSSYKALTGNAFNSRVDLGALTGQDTINFHLKILEPNANYNYPINVKLIAQTPDKTETTSETSETLTVKYATNTSTVHGSVAVQGSSVWGVDENGNNKVFGDNNGDGIVDSSDFHFNGLTQNFQAAFPVDLDAAIKQVAADSGTSLTEYVIGAPLAAASAISQLFGGDKIDAAEITQSLTDKITNALVTHEPKLYVQMDLDFKFGIESFFKMPTGDLAITLPYSTNVTTQHNFVNDNLQISTSNSQVDLQHAAFESDFSVDYGYNLAASLIVKGLNIEVDLGDGNLVPLSTIDPTIAGINPLSAFAESSNDMIDNIAHTLSFVGGQGSEESIKNNIYSILGTERSDQLNLSDGFTFAHIVFLQLETNRESGKAELTSSFFPGAVPLLTLGDPYVLFGQETSNTTATSFAANKFNWLLQNLAVSFQKAPFATLTLNAPQETLVGQFNDYSHQVQAYTSNNLGSVDVYLSNILDSLFSPNPPDATPPAGASSNPITNIFEALEKIPTALAEGFDNLSLDNPFDTIGPSLFWGNNNIQFTFQPISIVNTNSFDLTHLESLTGEISQKPFDLSIEGHDLGTITQTIAKTINGVSQYDSDANQSLNINLENNLDAGFNNQTVVNFRPDLNIDIGKLTADVDLYGFHLIPTTTFSMIELHNILSVNPASGDPANYQPLYLLAQDNGYTGSLETFTTMLKSEIFAIGGDHAFFNSFEPALSDKGYTESQVVNMFHVFGAAETFLRTVGTGYEELAPYIQKVFGPSESNTVPVVHINQDSMIPLHDIASGSVTVPLDYIPPVPV